MAPIMPNNSAFKKSTVTFASTVGPSQNGARELTTWKSKISHSIKRMMSINIHCEPENSMALELLANPLLL